MTRHTETVLEAHGGPSPNLDIVCCSSSLNCHPVCNCWQDYSKTNKLDFMNVSAKGQRTWWKEEAILV